MSKIEYIALGLVVILFAIAFLLAIELHGHNTFSVIQELPDYREVSAYVTGYNLVPEQTDSTPCIAANGENICGRTDTITCPRRMPFGTLIELDGRIYECTDRTHPRYDTRFDVNCNKDTACPYSITGIKTLKIYEPEK